MNVSLDLELKARNTFQNRIADVFNPDNERFKSIELKQLELECEKVLDKHEISLENRLFYSESLKMIKSSIFPLKNCELVARPPICKLSFESKPLVPDE